MEKSAFSKKFFMYLLVFIFLNIFLYVYILQFHNKIPFSKFDYVVNAHHYLEDDRVNGGKFDLLRALGQEDAQWYLLIGDTGYPSHPTDTDMNDKYVLNGLSYAFFPLYPMTIATVNFFLHNIELAAFVWANLLLLANFFSLFYVVKKLYNEETAFRTLFLLFFFPFAIFYRSYFTEGLFLLLLMWFSYFLIKKQWLWSSIFLSLLFVTRPNGLILGLVFLGCLIQAYVHKKVTKQILFGALMVSIIPFAGWLYFCYVSTGSPVYWFSVQHNWYASQNIMYPLLHNLSTFSHFSSLAWHKFHESKIDVLMVFIVGMVLFLSRKKLKPELWWISFLFWLVPLLTKDTMSFSRYQIVSFPLFLYLAMQLKGIKYVTVICLFALSLFLLSLYFVNWYWVG